jgi:hypothetical protein
LLAKEVVPPLLSPDSLKCDTDFFCLFTYNKRAQWNFLPASGLQFTHSMPFPFFLIFTPRDTEDVFAAMAVLSETLLHIFSFDFLMDRTVDSLIW